MNLTPMFTCQPARVLIVDDERHNRQLLEDMLAPEGLHLQTAASGEEALAIVAQRPPDLILLDIMMPGMDGHRVAREIKSNVSTNHIAIIMVSALDNREARMLALSAGVEDFLTKPVDRAELCVRVRNLLSLKTYGDYYEQQAATLAEQAALLDLAPDAIIVRDMHDRVLFWSRGAEAMYGWPSKEALGRNTHELLKTECSGANEQIDMLLRQGQWEGEEVHHTQAGRRLTVASRWALQRDKDGEPIRMLAINNDITERNRAESERASLTERLSLATAVARVGVWECDWVTKTLTWDATMFDIYGISPVARMSCDDWTTAIFPEDLPTLQATLQKVVDEKSLGRSEFRIVRPDGSVRNVSGVQGVDLDDRGNVSRLIGVNMDVTERKQAEEALEQSRMDQMRFKDEFMSHVSHELRSPLTAIKQFTTILLGGLAGELNKEQREYELIVLKNIRQLQAMIDDLLEVTRLGAGKLTAEPECISVADVVADTLDTMRVTAKAKGIMLSWNSPPELPQAYADPTRLEQILIILLDNAIKFTASGGNVRIQAKLQPQDPFLLLEVSDTGCGISAEITGKIFERLYQVSSATQSSRKGLGLGLYICKQLVTQQGGQIYVESQPGKGSTFSFTMPVFSLRSVIAPLLKDDKWPAKSAAIVMVTIELPGAWPSRESREEWCRDALVLIQRCLLPDLDVLLPKVRSGSGERFIVAAFAEQHGVSILANRIREQFERHLLLKQTGMTISVSHRMLQPFPQAVGASLEKAVADMATNLEESIKSQIISEAVYHG